ncbi:hypothetical protein ABK040_005127 [Willaertia magna]
MNNNIQSTKDSRTKANIPPKVARSESRNNLPLDIIEEILSFIGSNDCLLRCAQVSKSWKIVTGTFLRNRSFEIDASVMSFEEMKTSLSLMKALNICNRLSVRNFEYSSIKFSQISKEIPTLHLEYLRLSYIYDTSLIKDYKFSNLRSFKLKTSWNTAMVTSRFNFSIVDENVNDEGFQSLVESGQLTNLTELEVLAVVVDLTLLKNMPNLHNISLTIPFHITLNERDESLKNLLLGNAFKNLTSLTLRSYHFTKQGVKYLASSEFLPNLIKLDLANSIKTEGVGELICKPMKKLEKLNLSSCNVKLADQRLLLKQPYCSNLRHLSLSNNMMGDEGFKLLSTASLLNLSVLRLESCFLTDEAFDNFTTNHKLHNLIELNLNGNSLSVYSLNKIACGKMLKLKTLILTRIHLNDSEDFTDGFLPNLTELRIDGNYNFNHFYTNPLNKFCNMEVMPKLSKLYIGTSVLGSFENFKLENCLNLTFLDMTGASLNDKSMKSFLRCPPPKLTQLLLNFNPKLSDETVSSIINSGLLRTLRKITLCDTSVSKEGYEMLIAAKLGLNVGWREKEEEQ